MGDWDNEDVMDEEFTKAKKKDGEEEVLDLSDEEDEDALFGDFEVAEDDE